MLNCFQETSSLGSGMATSSSSPGPNKVSTVERSADCKSAIRQIPNLRYEPGLDRRGPFDVAMQATRQHFRCMKRRTRTVPFTSETVATPMLLVLELALCLFLVGCASTKIDWNSRIGNYTYDQAVTELGPPDKQAKLTDGTVVAEWMTRRGYSGGSVGLT